MPNLWIIHRDPRQRAGLVRLAAAAAPVVGGPGDPVFDEAAPADVVLLGLPGGADDWEPELEFAHSQHARVGGARWVLLGAPGQSEAALALFDSVVAEFLVSPPPSAVLRERLLAARSPGSPPSLSQRARREAITARFGRWLADLELPELFRALDPRLSDVPVLIRGEPGSGRGVVARYLHHMGGSGGGGLAHVPCTPETSAEELLDALAELGRARPRLSALGIWLDDAGRLREPVQRRVREWVEAGPPPGVRAPRIRWIGTHDTTARPLEPGLARSLGRLDIHLPPLRERIHRLEAIVAETSRAWSRARRESPRRFGEDALAVMEEYPWPGNLRELEALVEQTLAAVASDPIRSDDLQLDGVAFAPLDASEIGDLLSEGESGEIGPGPSFPMPVSRVESPAATKPDTPEAPIQAAPARADDVSLSKLVTALSHEVRNPLATIRTFASLLPERFDDPEFRTRFAEMVNEDVSRIDGLVERFSQLASLDQQIREKIDVSALLEGLLDERRDAFRARNLLVLKELEAGQSTALADAAQLRLAFEALLDKAIDMVPERGDLYIASRHHRGGRADAASVRVLLRFHDPSAGGSAPELSPVEQSLEFLFAEQVIRAQNGRLTLSQSDGEERVVVIDLPAA